MFCFFYLRVIIVWGTSHICRVSKETTAKVESVLSLSCLQTNWLIYLHWGDIDNTGTDVTTPSLHLNQLMKAEFNFNLFKSLKKTWQKNPPPDPKVTVHSHKLHLPSMNNELPLLVSYGEAVKLTTVRAINSNATLLYMFPNWDTCREPV